MMSSSLTRLFSKGTSRPRRTSFQHSRPAVARILMDALERRQLLSASLNITGNGASIANGENSPTAATFTDFGDASTTPNGTLGFVTRTFTIANISSDTIALTGGANLVQVTGADAADFTVTTAPTNAIASGNSTTFTIQFLPTAAGARSATISIFNSSADESTFSFTVAGTGLATSNSSNNLQVATRQAGAGAVTAANGDVLQVSFTGTFLTGTLFDSTAIEGGTPTTFRLDNTPAHLFITNDKTGNRTVDTSLISGWEQGLQGAKVGETRTLIIPSTLAYGPTGKGNIPPNATLIFDITVDQIGYSPALQVSGNGINIVPGAITTTASDGTDFGAVPSGTAVTHSFSLFDVSEATDSSGNLIDGLAINSASVSGINSGDFKVANSGPGVFTVTFKTSAPGPRSALINLFSNDPLHPDYTFTVTGGTAAGGPSDITGALLSSTVPASVIAGTPLTGKFSVAIVNDGQSVLPKNQKAVITLLAHNTSTGVNTPIATSPSESVAGLKIGLSKAFTFPVKFTPGLAAGTYQYFAQLTPSPALAESNTANDLLTTTAAGAPLTLTVSPAFSDLTGSLVSSSLKSSATGVTGKVSVFVVSKGNFALPASQQIQLEIIANGVPTAGGLPGDFTLQTSIFSVKGWKPGKSATFNVPVKLLTPLGGATYTLEADILALPLIAESNVINNTITTNAQGNPLSFTSTNPPQLSPFPTTVLTSDPILLLHPVPASGVVSVQAPPVQTPPPATGGDTTGGATTTSGMVNLNSGAGLTVGNGSTIPVSDGNTTLTPIGGTLTLGGGNANITSAGNTTIITSSNITTTGGNTTLSTAGNTTLTLGSGSNGTISLPPAGSGGLVPLGGPTLVVASPSTTILQLAGLVSVTWSSDDPVVQLSFAQLQSFPTVQWNGNGHTISVNWPTLATAGVLTVDGVPSTYTSVTCGSDSLTFTLAPTTTT